ncbi:SAM-dependent methyltransferase [Actinomadura sp. DC4]|uniref:SAM-dependent methyltransferase n=1 Tax=Actinomadura sp. DC4 TaxID=3055069 RepID=UPI0025B1F533|nr:SAM-dependent methyltransferase [Actinomadura sp. DC4]MDN3352801.1 SAM-dependent methyltransferase [Actinomadura sp. DC4]
MTGDEWFRRTGATGESAPPAFDSGTPHIARVQDYWLGGKDHFQADREAGDEAVEAFPGLVASVRNTRAFLARSVRYLARDAGVRQFLDIGTGIPAANNTHEVAQAAAPECRIVYTDHDPAVLAHARALLTSHPKGATAYLDADLRDPEKILLEAAQTLDFSQPVALMLVAILHCIPDGDDPYGIVNRLREAVPPGSYLVISHPANDIQAEQMGAMAKSLNRVMAQKVTPRGFADVARFFDGLELVEPGIVRASEWRPAPEYSVGTTVSTMWSGVARFS